MKYIFILFTFSILYSCKNGSDLKQVTNEDEFLIIPEGLKKYSKEKILQKYPAKNSPRTVFGNNDMSVTIGISLDEGDMTKSELVNFAQSMKTSFQQQLEVQWISDEIKKIDNHSFTIMKFYSQVEDGMIYNMMCVSEHNNKLVMLTFNCLPEESDIWDEKFEKSLKSASFKRAIVKN